MPDLLMSLIAVGLRRAIELLEWQGITHQKLPCARVETLGTSRNHVQFEHFITCTPCVVCICRSRAHVDPQLLSSLQPVSEILVFT